MVVICHCTWKIKILPIKLGKDLDHVIGWCASRKLVVAVQLVRTRWTWQWPGSWFQQGSGWHRLKAAPVACRLSTCEGRVTIDPAFPYFSSLGQETVKSSKWRINQGRKKLAGGDYSKKFFFLFACVQPNNSRPQTPNFQRRSEEETVLAARVSCVGFICAV